MTPHTEIELYLDHARRDLQAAESNLQLGYHNVVISRSYYAMFYATSALLASQNISRSKHTGVLSAFGEYFIKTGLIETEYAKMLGHAFDSRLDSDYDMTFAVDATLARELWHDAQRFVDHIEQYLHQAGALGASS
jgi:uncharacterized protein (UPF0332 family)